MSVSAIDILRAKVCAHGTRRFIDGNRGLTIEELTSMTPLELRDSVERVFGTLSAPAYSVVVRDLATTLHTMGYKFAFEK